jgi:hypothetical protein
MQFDLRLAHKHSSQHRVEILASQNCGCFFCLSIYPALAVVEWLDEDQTAFCPECGIDSVIGDASGYPITSEFLASMKKQWFSNV